MVIRVSKTCASTHPEVSSFLTHTLLVFEDMKMWIPLMWSSYCTLYWNTVLTLCEHVQTRCVNKEGNTNRIEPGTSLQTLEGHLRGSRAVFSVRSGGEVMGGRAELWSLSTEFSEHTVSLKTALKHSQRSGFMKDGLKKASTEGKIKCIVPP